MGEQLLELGAVYGGLLHPLDQFIEEAAEMDLGEQLPGGLFSQGVGDALFVWHYRWEVGIGVGGSLGGGGLLVTANAVATAQRQAAAHCRIGSGR